MTEQILRAPPLRQRVTKLGLWCGAGAIAVALTEFWVFPWLRTWLSVADPVELMFRLRVVFAGLSLSILAPAVWAFHLARRVLKVGQWPLPATFVLRDTPVITGRGVRVRGRVLIAWSVLTAVLGIFALMMPDLMRAA